MMKRLNQLIQSRFIRNVLIVATGTAGAQAITMLFAPLITRIYGPEAFGLLGVFVAILAIGTPIAALSYPIAIVLPRSDEDAIGLAKLSVLVALVISLIAFLIIYLFGSILVELLGSPAISGFLFLIPIAIFSAGFLQTIQQWLIRKQQFKIIGRVAVSQSLILNVSKTAIGLAYPAGVVLVVLATFGYALHAIQLWVGAKVWSRDRSRVSKLSETFLKISLLARVHKDFPLYRAPQVFVNSVAAGTPVLILAMFFDAATVGYFALSNSILSAPAVLIGKSVGSVFYPRIVSTIHEGEHPWPIIIKSMILLGGVSFLPFLTIFLFSEAIFSFVFGDEWAESGNFASIVALSVFLGIVHRPCESIIYTYSLVNRYFQIELFFTIVMVAVMYYLGGAGYTAHWIVFAYMLVKSSYYLVVTLFCFWAIYHRA